MQYHSVDINPYTRTACETTAATYGMPASVMYQHRCDAVTYLQQQADASYDAVIATHVSACTRAGCM